MTTKTAPKTAAEARRLAEDLAAAERDMSQRRAAADKAARIEEAKRQLEHADTVLARERTEAAGAMQAAISDPTVGVEKLAELVIAAKSASARRAAAVRAAASVLDALDPLRSPVSGQPIQHRNDTHDNLANLTLTSVLDDAVRHRVSDDSRTVYDAIDTAGAAAAAAIK